MTSEHESLQEEAIAATIQVLMGKHDWYFEASDDIRLFRRGQMQKLRILELMRKIPVNRVALILKKIPIAVREDWFMSLAVPDREHIPRPDSDVPMNLPYIPTHEILPGSTK